MERLSFIRPVSTVNPNPKILAACTLGAEPGMAVWSQDRQALLIPELWVSPEVIRAVVAGKTIVEQLSDLVMIAFAGGPGTIPTRWYYRWGDLQVFRTGKPVVDRVIFLPHTLPDHGLDVVARYLKEAQQKAVFVSAIRT